MNEPFLRDRMCSDCPFHKAGPGKRLADSLNAGRLEEIKKDLIHDAHFICHKTTLGTGDGSYQICRGAHDWQIEHRGSPSILFRILKLIPEHYEIYQRVARRQEEQEDEYD